jgi:tetratricopeptide (TPR) repeat protein
MPRPSALSPLELGALVALVNAGRLSEAESHSRTLLRQHPDTGMLWKILSVALVRQGKEALNELGQASKLLPEDGEAHRNLGAAHYDRGQWAAALPSLQRALALQPGDVQTLIDAANTMRQLLRPNEAIPMYQRALSLSPDEAEARNNLGNAYLESQQYRAAEREYQLALKLRPRDAQVLCNVGFAQAALGRREEAATHFRESLAQNPALVEALNGLGNVLRDLGDRREAAAHFRRAIELDPGRAESHAHLGAVLFELRRVDEAMASFGQALALKPDHAPAHLGLALALRQQRRPEDAEASCTAALAADPHYVEAAALLGELRADRGRFAEAEVQFAHALALQPDFAPAYASIATHRRMTVADTEWLKGALSLAAQRLPLAHAIGLHYALGKYYDDVGQYDDAFEHYTQANRSSKRFGAPYDRGQLTVRVSQIIRSFDSAFMQRISASPGSELPVFIVGMPRSGTSLAEQILASHPSVHGAGELLHWNGAYDAYRRAEAEQQDAVALIPGMAGEYLERLKRLGGDSSRVVDKMPANFWYAGLLHAAFPSARIIHMQRHPFDTCLSVYFQNFFNIGAYAHDLVDLAHFYGEYLRVMDHWRRVLPATALLEVPYEGLVADPESWARKMLACVGLPWDPRCLDFHQTDRVVITASKWQVRQKISKASVGRWRNYEKHIGPLRALGHAVPTATGAPSGDAPPLRPLN